ncbi:MAG: hypothetical protein HYY84_13910 [Deltaproteobacteria bacterium]|nr:hypothetical protein [Deltaproteobacteria bacterium]
MRRRLRKPTTRPKSLRFVLPNPNAYFVGRDKEAVDLRAAIERSSLSVVWAYGGFGKTSLVLQTVHRFFKTHARRTAVVSLRASESPMQALADIVRGACQVAGIDSNPWSAVRGDWESALAMTIEIVDETGAWIFLDNLHAMPLRERDDLLHAVAKYARKKSKWIATTRERPLHTDLDAHLFCLPAMSDDDLSRLVRARLPSASERAVAHSVKAASGSPWRLIQIIAAKRAAATGADGILAGLSEASCAFVKTLAVLDGALSPQFVSGLGPAPSDGEMERLERLGLIEETPAGYRLHDVARPLVEAEIGQPVIDAHAPDVARALAQVDESAVAMEAIRIFLAHRERDAALTLLRTRDERLITEGYGTQLWHLLQSVRDERFSRTQLRAAVAAADPLVLDIVREPDASEFDARLAWVRAVSLRQRGASLGSVARCLADDAVKAKKTDIAFEAGMIAGLALRLSANAKAERIVRRVPSGTAAQAARQMALLAAIVGMRGDRQQGDLLVAKVMPLLAKLDAESLIEVANRICSHYLYFGLIRRAREFFDRWLPDIERRPVLTVGDRFSLVTFYCVNVFGGDFRRAAALRDETKVLMALSDILRLAQATLDIPLDLAVGNFANFHERITRNIELCDGTPGSNHNRKWFLACRVQMAILYAEPYSVSEPGVESNEYMGSGALHLKATLLLQAMHQFDDVPTEIPSDPEFDGIEDEQCWLLIARSVHVLRMNRMGLAGRFAHTAVRNAEVNGIGIVELEARAALCDVLCASGAFRELRAEAGALAKRAREAGSPRFEHEAEFFVFAASKDSAKLATLMMLARLEDVAPVAMRRARCLLGAAANRDRVDNLVLAAIARRAQAFRIETTRGPVAGEWDPESWGIDDVERCVVLPGNRVVDLGTRETLWKVLAALAGNGGMMETAALFSSTWNIGDFHPIRHGKRLHKVIHDLRLLIEDDPARPKRLITTETGYAFGQEAAVFRRVLRDRNR